MGRTGARQGPRRLQRSGSRRYLRAGTRGLGQSDPGRVREMDRPLLSPAADGEVREQPWRLRLRRRRVSGLDSEGPFPDFSHSHPCTVTSLILNSPSSSCLRASALTSVCPSPYHSGLSSEVPPHPVTPDARHSLNITLFSFLQCSSEAFFFSTCLSSVSLN